MIKKGGPPDDLRRYAARVTASPPADVKMRLATSEIHGVSLFAAEFIGERTVVWESNPEVVEQRPARRRPAALPHEVD